MGRPLKIITDLGGMPPLRQYWRDINRHESAVKAWERANRKARDKKRSACRCDAYKFPHRPGGGLCRYPDPPAVRWRDTQAAEIAERVNKFKKRFGEPAPEQMNDLIALTAKPTRRYRKRYAGILRQICRTNGLHPIRDRELIEQLLPGIKAMAEQLHRLRPWKWKYRNMKIIDNGDGTYGLRGEYQPAGSKM